MYVLSVVSESASHSLQPHLDSLLTLCDAALKDESTPDVPYFAIM